MDLNHFKLKWLPWLTAGLTLFASTIVLAQAFVKNSSLQEQLKTEREQIKIVRRAVVKSNDLDNFKAKYLRVLAGNQKLEAENNAYRSQLDSAEEAEKNKVTQNMIIENLQRQIARMTTDGVKRVTGENEFLRAENETLKGALNELQQSEITSRQKIAEAEAAALKSEKEFILFRESLKEAQSKTESLTGENKLLKDREAAADKEIQKIRADLEKRGSEIQKIKEEINNGSEQKSLLLKEIERSKTQIQTLTDDLKKRRSESEKAQTELARVKAELKNSQDHIRRDAGQKQDWLKEIKRLKEQIQGLQKTIAGMDKVKNELAFKDSEKLMESLRLANTKAEKLGFQTAAAHYNLGVLYSRLGEHAEAAQEFTYALNLRPEDPMTHYNLAVLNDAYLKKPQAAMPHYEAYVRLLPNASDAREVQQRIYEMRMNDEVSLSRDLRQKIR